jgi:uncharacterized RDD family membrane protein YckC
MNNPYAPPRAAVRDIADPSMLATPADRGTRLGAAILDGFIFGAMVYLPMLFAAGAFGSSAQSGEDNAGPNAMSIVLGVATLVGFTVWCWLTIRYMKRNSQSIAKKLLSIKVVRTDGSHASLGRIFWLRNVVNGLISIIPLYGFVETLFIFGESRQCLHDRIAGTIVVKA